MSKDTIYRQDAINAICKACLMEEDYHKCDGYPETSTWCEELVALRTLPSVQPEITDVQAILHLQSTGWMQNHDREMYESGLREQLADDSGSYDSIISCKDAIVRLPSAQPERKTGHWLVKQDHNGSTYGECSQCHSIQYAGHTPYCPYCGSHNGGEQNE